MDILPDSRTQTPTGVVRGVHTTPSYTMMLNWVPVYCANCGKPGLYVPDIPENFVCYLCEPCAEKLPPIEGTYVEPDIVFWRKVHEAQLEKYGRLLTPDETVQALQDGTHMLSKLARERR